MVKPESEHQFLKQELEFRTALVDLTNELLSSTLNATFYQTALERTVQLVPDAQGGSVLIRHDDGLYHFEAAVEFDSEVLKSITLCDEEMGKRAGEANIEKIEIHEEKRRLDPGKVKLFQEAGRLSDIRATLSVPLQLRGQTVGYLNLDNFTSQQAFTENDIEIAKAIAGQVSLALYRLFLERRLEQERQHYQHMANHDPLTGLPNRRFFLDALERALAHAARRESATGLLYVDINDFKRMNDRYGHDVGDRLLGEAAARIGGAVRAGDVAARLGGDEFGVLLIDVHGPEDTQKVAAKVKTALSAPMTRGEQVFIMKASIGTATYPEHATTAEELLKIADTKMYEMKHAAGA
ncbi:MAG: sensor domain-containing diguanylate cyclase [Spirochaetia bacterium]